MNRFDFTPYRRSTVGFDRLFDLLENQARGNAGENYPPFNIERRGEDSYRITLAVAGFRPDELAQRLFDGWVQSPPHRRNLLDGDMTDVGTAVAQSRRSGRYYAVQLFGRPRSEHRAMRDAAARANGEQDQTQTSATSTTNGDYTRGGRDPALTPSRTPPPPGAINNGLSGGGSGGVLPDPYADPNRAPR